MDRIRAGLTGLAAVFLVTAAASLLFAPDEAETIAAEQQEPGEPLAQLGVAPGSDPGIDGADTTEVPPAETGVPPLEAQPSGGPQPPGARPDPAYPGPTISGGAAEPGRPVAI
jgi:hypothetical protein